ncbi:MAG: TonB-dependent receptor [Gemmatimonadota bacterium]
MRIRGRLSIHGVAVATVALAVTIGPIEVRAQIPEHPEGEIEGRVVDESDGRSLAGSQVSVMGLRQSAITHGDGSFHLPGMRPGNYVLTVERLGYRTEAVLVTVSEQSAFVTVRLTATPFEIPGLVVTGALSERESQDVLRPVDVVSGDELQRQLQATVASTLTREPGVSATSVGPATARPVIRGLSGDRVLMLEDGTRVGDVSNEGADHATALDPSSARRIEVVRGPAALLYGSNALGGVINVIRDEVPSTIPHHVTGEFTVQGQSVSDAYAGSGSMLAPLSDHVPFRLEATGRKASDLATPVGALQNTQIETWSASAGSGYVGDWGYLGGSFRLYRNDYGIPGDEGVGFEDGVRIKMRRTAAKLQGAVDRNVGPFESLDFNSTYITYKHDEIEPGAEPETAFDLQTVSGDVLARHGEIGPFSSGAFGARGSFEDFAYGGEVSTTDTRRYTGAAYLFEELELDPIRIEGGVRYDWVHVVPLVEDASAPIGFIRDRTFHSASGSLGVLYHVGGGVTLGTSVARAFRTPDILELFSDGAHLAAYSYEIGNPDLGTEVGTGVDVFARFGSESLNAELTGFYNSISGYVYGEETGASTSEGLPIYQYQGNDARMTGFEGSLDWTVVSDLVAHGTASYVRGTLQDTDEPLPLIPPLHGTVGLEYSPTEWFVRTEVDLTAKQDRLGAFETVTDGYAVFNASAGMRMTVGGHLNVLTLSVDNITDKQYYNHLSRIKDLMPEAGRGVSLAYRVVF